MTSKITNICINEGVNRSKIMTFIFIFIGMIIFLFIKCNVIHSDGKSGFGEMTSLQSKSERDPYSQCTPQRF